jgi:hypothetical protein
MHETGIEWIRRREVSCALKRLDPSPKDAEAIDGLSRAIVDEIVRGPIAAAVPSGATAGGREGGEDACAS